MCQCQYALACPSSKNKCAVSYSNDTFDYTHARPNRGTHAKTVTLAYPGNMRRFPFTLPPA